MGAMYSAGLESIARRRHAEIADCVNGFVGESWNEGICQVGSDGNDHAYQHP